MTAAASLTDDQLDRIYIAAQTGNLAELRRAIERELAASPAAAAGVPTAHTPAVKRLIAAARAAYDHRYQSGAPINSIYEELQLAAEDISSPVAPVGAPTARMLTEDETMDAYNMPHVDGEPYPHWIERMDATVRKFCEVNGIALLSRQGCELATDATKQFGEEPQDEHSGILDLMGQCKCARCKPVHLAATPIDQDFRMRPASSEAAPSAEGSE